MQIYFKDILKPREQRIGCSLVENCEPELNSIDKAIFLGFSSDKYELCIHCRRPAIGLVRVFYEESITWFVHAEDLAITLPIY